MVAVPDATPVTTPDVELIVATLVLLDDQAPPVTVDDNVVVPFEHIAVVPLNVPPLAGAVTVTVLVAVTLEQPPVPKTV
jgi:hypothetical protein